MTVPDDVTPTRGQTSAVADLLGWRLILGVLITHVPVSSLAQAMRELWGNGPAAPPDAQLPLHHPILATILWSVAMTAVLAPFALRAYARRTSD